MMTDKVSEVLQALEDALKFWAIQLSASDGDLKKNVPAATVDNPLQELVKIIKLIRAHTTKVGIIYEPSKLEKSGDASVSTVSDLSKSFVLFLSALAQVSVEEISHLFYDEIKSMALNLVVSATSFTEELKALYADATSAPSEKTDTKEDKDTNSEVDARLVSVGKIWNICDDFTKLVEGGKLKVLEKKTKMHLSLIEDGLDEFAEWAENPEDMDEEDPFGLDDDFSDDFSDEEDDEDGSKPPVSDEDDEETSEQASKDREDLIKYSKLWLQKFKLVKLLFLSINKSLSTLTAGKSIDEIYSTEALIAREIDTLIVELMLNHTLDEVVEKHAFAVDKACFKIISILRETNKKSEAKVKWCASWESKYKEFSEDMYN